MTHLFLTKRQVGNRPEMERFEQSRYLFWPYCYRSIHAASCTQKYTKFDLKTTNMFLAAQNVHGHGRLAKCGRPLFCTVRFLFNRLMCHRFHFEYQIGRSSLLRLCDHLLHTLLTQCLVELRKYKYIPQWESSPSLCLTQVSQ